MRLRLLFLPALFLALSLQAQTPVINWIKKNGPTGGDIRDIEINATTGKVYLLDAANRPFVSVDGGETWEKLVVSTDNNYFNDIEITNNTIFFVGGYELFISIDGGVSFQEKMTQVSPYSDARRLKRMPTSGNLVVLSYNSIYTSSNNGETWTLRNSTLTDADERYLEVNAVDQIFIISENGAFETRPFRSTNGGVSFSEVSTGIPAGHNVLGLYGENNGAMIYGVTSTDVFSSANGTSWTSVKAGIADATINDYGSYNNAIIEFSADGLGMYFVDNLNHKLYSKTVAATTWDLQAIDFPSASLSVSSASAKDYPSATTSTAFFGSPSGVFKTTTGGASVTENNTGIASVQAEQILGDYYNYLYIRTSSLGLLKSQDGGNNWTNIPTLSSDIEHFFTDDDGYPLYAVVDYNILKRSYDQGASWFEVSPIGGFTWAASPGDGQVFGLAHTSYPIGLYYSSDNGSTWPATPVSVTGLPAQFSIDTYKGIIFASPTRMFLSLYDYALSDYFYYRIDFTYDINNAITGATAAKITTLPIPMDDIYKATAANGNLYLFDNYSASSDRVAISSDGGVSWVTRAAPSSSEFFMAKNGYLFFVNGNTGKVHLSQDDALTFIETTLAENLDAYDLNDINIDNNGYAYLAFNGDYVYQSANTIVLPAPLSDLQQLGNTATAVALDWKDINQYDRDIIIERSVNGVDFVVAGQVSGWNTCYGSGDRGYFVDTNLQAGTNYTYRVKARNAAGTSAPTSTLSVSTLADCAQSIPENRSWSAINSGIEGYDLIDGNSDGVPDPVNVGIKHLGGGKYEISNLSLSLTGSAELSTFFESCGQTVVGQPGDINPNGNGTWDGTTLTLKWSACGDGNTETISLTVNASDPIPAKPAALLAYVVNNTSIEVKWTAAYYEKTYVLERSLSPGSGFVQVTSVDYPQTTYIDSDPALVLGTTYYYRLKSLNGNTVPEPSPYSDVVSVPFNKPNFLVADNAITNFSASATIGSIWADFNNDGFEDYLTMRYDPENEIANPMIFKNLGGGDFEQIPVDIGEVKYFLPSVVDYDNDHLPDIALSGDETRVLDIFKGNGDFTFSKIPTGQLGDLAIIEKEVAASSWADINRDGLPDIMLLSGEDGSFVIYKQNANHSFSKAFQGAPSEDEPLLSVWADYDNDGFQDFLVGNLDGAGGLFHNNGDETFTKVTGNGFDGTNYFSAAWGDYNNDGHIDLFCGSVAMNALYKNNGDGTFTKDVSTLISEQSFTLSGAWGDYNNDGYLDLMTVSIPQEGSRSRLFLRDPAVTGSVVFKKIITEKINDPSVAHYSVANADPDQNGQLDIAMSAFTFSDSEDEILPVNNNFYQNNTTLQNWSRVKLNPTSGSTESLGAKITLTSAGKTQSREISASSSLVSRNSTIAHFGLGSATTITNIQVTWPSGAVQNYPLPPANQLLVIDEDVAGPVITSHTPANNATAVSPNTSVTLVFDEAPFAVPGKKIFFTKTGDGSPFVSIDVSSGIKTVNQFEFTLPSSLQPLTEYNVTIDAGAFRDRFANPSAEMTAGTWKFQTSDAPAIVSMLPAHNATNVSAVTTLSVTFNRPVTASSGKFVKIYKSTDLVTPVQSIDAATGAITGNTVAFTPSTKLQRSVDYHVSIDPGAFVDAGSIGSQGLASSAWVFTTDPGPSYTVVPLHNAINVAANASLQITFNKNVTRAVGKKITVRDGATVVSEGDVSLVGTLAANVYTYPAPSSGWPFNKVLKVTLDEGAFVDAQGNDCAAIVAESWNFTTIETPDIEPPSIAFTAPPSPSKGFGSTNPSITVTDNIGVNTVVVSIRKISGAAYTDLVAAAGAGNTYSVTLSEATHFDAIGAEFYIMATDASGNSKRDPEGTSTHKVYLTYDETNSGIPSSALGFGGEKSNWKVFAIPFELSSPNNAVNIIFDELAGLDSKNDYRLITINDTRDDWKEYPSFTAIARGQGYFINIKQVKTIKLYNGLTAPANSRSNLFPMTLKPGWNMLGNPYLTQIDWADVSAYNDLSGDAASLVKYNGTGYAATSQVLAPYEGGFVNNPTAIDIPISIPFDGQTESGGRTRSAGFDPDINGEQWIVALNLRQQEQKYEMGAIGMSPDASASLDIFDRITPPRFFDYLELNFSHPEHFQKRFTRDVVPAQSCYTWEFTVDSNLEGQAEINWDNSAFYSGAKDLYLLDVSGQKLLNMREIRSYRFDSKVSSRFRIYYGDNLNIAPERVQLGKAYPNPTQRLTTIGFSLPETGGLNQNVTLELLDALGRPVGTVAHGIFDPGYHEAAFDATEMMNGFYTYRLTVKNRRGNTTEVNKLIIK